MRLENMDVDYIYVGVCVVVQSESTTRRTMSKPHATVVEWDDEIILWVLLYPFLLVRAYGSKTF